MAEASTRLLSPKFIVCGEAVYKTSSDIAEHFQSPHTKINATIDNILEAEDICEEFSSLNFVFVDHVERGIQMQSKTYLVSHCGFLYLFARGLLGKHSDTCLKRFLKDYETAQAEFNAYLAGDIHTRTLEETESDGYPTSSQLIH